MRHVDEGTIHAWLDQQVTDPQEVARITAHLRECATCSARVAEEEATIRDAEALLSSVAPYADGSREAFDALVAGAAQRNGTGERATSGNGSTRSGRSYPWWMASAGWAATIVLAVGIGWSARYLMSSRDVVEPPSVSPAPQQMARTEAPPAQPPDIREQDATLAEPTPKAARPPRVSGTRQKPPAPVEERVQPGPPPTQGDAADTSGLSPLPTTRSVTSLLNLVPSSPQPFPTTPPPQAAPPFALPFRAPETVQVTAEAPVVDVQNARQQVTVPGSPATAEAPVSFTMSAVAPSESAPPPPTGGQPGAAGGRGGGRGGGGGPGGGRAGGGRAAVPAPAPAGGGQFAAGAGTDSINQGRIVVDGLPINGTETADGIDWTVMSRDAARERSRMSLYGIDGLTPARTMVNADGSKVRTVYVVNAAEVVLLQEKPPAQDTSLERSIPGPGPATASTAPTFRTGLGAGAVAQQAQAAPTRWSATRGDVVLTVQGTDAAGFGARVRLD